MDRPFRDLLAFFRLKLGVTICLYSVFCWYFMKNGCLSCNKKGQSDVIVTDVVKQFAQEWRWLQRVDGSSFIFCGLRWFWLRADFLGCYLFVPATSPFSCRGALRLPCPRPESVWYKELPIYLLPFIVWTSRSPLLIQSKYGWEEFTSKPGKYLNSELKIPSLRFGRLLDSVWKSYFQVT